MAEFICHLPVRITDLNYGGHLAHDRLIGMLHEARCQFLASVDCSEKDFYGIGLILKKIEVEYCREAFLHDNLKIVITISHVKSAQFTMIYQIYKDDYLVAKASTLMVGFDYHTHKVSKLPPTFYQEMSAWIM